jgi:hypothetical protein
MEKKREYYEFTANLPTGSLIQYIEFYEGWAIRQAECLEGKWFSYSETKNSSYLADQPLSELYGLEHNAINVTEFEDAWRKSVKADEVTEVNRTAV